MWLFEIWALSYILGKCITITIFTHIIMRMTLDQNQPINTPSSMLERLSDAKKGRINASTNAGISNGKWSFKPASSKWALRQSKMSGCMCSYVPDRKFRSVQPTKGIVSLLLQNLTCSENLLWFNFLCWIGKINFTFFWHFATSWTKPSKHENIWLSFGVWRRRL